MSASGELPEERIDMGRLEDLILSDSRRGMDRIADLLPADYCAQAGEFVLSWPRGRVLLVTGFFVSGQGETDGPPGTKLIYDALRKLGFSPLVVTDPFCAAYFTAARVPFVTFSTEAREGDLRALLEREKPMGLIAVERCGRAADGRYVNSLGQDIRVHTAPLDGLFLLSDAPSVGIGDGGNEIGMGNLAAGVAERLDRVPCAVKTDRLIIATVSNWGALGLCAALNQLPEEEALLAAYDPCSHTGLVDGITCEPVLSEDGFSVDHVKKLRNDLENVK